MDESVPVRVTPRASSNRIEVRDGLIRIYVTTAPTDGEANDAVIKLLAKALQIAASRIAMVRGETSRNKLLRIDDFEKEQVISRLTQ